MQPHVPRGGKRIRGRLTHPSTPLAVPHSRGERQMKRISKKELLAVYRQWKAEEVEISDLIDAIARYLGE